MGNALQVQIVARTGGIFYLQIVAIVVKELLQGLDEQEVDGKPHGTTPVRVAAEEPGARLRRLVTHAMLRAVDGQRVRIDPNMVTFVESVP